MGEIACSIPTPPSSDDAMDSGNDQPTPQSLRDIIEAEIRQYAFRHEIILPSPFNTTRPLQTPLGELDEKELGHLRIHSSRLQTMLHNAIQSELACLTTTGFPSKFSIVSPISNLLFWDETQKEKSTENEEPCKDDDDCSIDGCECHRAVKPNDNESSKETPEKSQDQSLGSIIGDEDDPNKQHLDIGINFPHNLHCIIQYMNGELPSSTAQILRLETPASKMIPVIEALQRREELPLCEELIHGDQETVPRVISNEMTEFIKLLGENDARKVYESLQISERIEDEVPSTIVDYLPALNKRVSLYQETTAFYQNSSQKVLLICPSEKIEGIRSQLEKTNIPADDIHTLDKDAKYDLSELWTTNPYRNNDPHLLARHQIDDLRVRSHKMQKEMEELAEIIKSPLSNSSKVLEYLCQSGIVEADRHFHAFWDTEFNGKIETGTHTDFPLSQKYKLVAAWIAGKSIDDLLEYTTPAQYQDIWDADEATRKTSYAIWECEIRQTHIKKLLKILEDFSECQRELNHYVIEHSMRVSKVLSKRVILCAAQDIAACLPQLSCIKADTVLVQGADQIDEGFLLAALPENTSRLVLIKEHRSSQDGSQKDGESSHPEPISSSLWVRLETAGFPVTNFTWQKKDTSDEANKDESGNKKETNKEVAALDTALENSGAWKKLQEMVGLEEVKERVRLLHQQAKVNAQRKSKDLSVHPISLNGVFLGPPGVGKTTVAALYGQILADLKLLSIGRVVERSAPSLIGEYIGETEKFVRDAINSAEGDVLVIDDAYAFWGGRQGSHCFHKAAIDALVTSVSKNGTKDQCILLLGYEHELSEMMRQANPGLQSRFPLEMAFRFVGYTLPQLEDILDLQLKKDGYSLTDEARSAVLAMIRQAMISPRFGNARHVQTLLDTAYLSLGKRALENPEQDPTILEPEDFSKDWNRVVDAETECRSLFEGVVGCDALIEQLLDYTRIAKKANERKLNARDYIPFNYVFRGPPGTGKTTTARRMGEIFYRMGLLATSEVIECSVTDMIGEYVGSTGPKVLEVFDRGLGKVLFIDEAYRLFPGPDQKGSFASEAIGEIVGALTSPRFQNNMVVILAGYGPGMDSLIASNPGLRSRFKQVMTFDSLSGEQCAQLLVQVLNKQGVLDTSPVGIPKHATHTDLCNLFTALSKTEGWGNARDVNMLSEDITCRVILQSSSSADPLTVSRDVIYESLLALVKRRGGRQSGPIKPQNNNRSQSALDRANQYARSQF
ncbi:P-loop containing nucleoside triphosphate hydrolase protein [Penicillium malachiteum]|uniref:P-loop containing nucleoside triphosphate hydrolase protein n=1 Tax=Penicillium malachiteum TaxID=1324776 RepID=UPI0025480416|nr:P-loop containing nucleoside triphosphate hydrolase protein [Penicillium malachiteum]KAJ5720806.1 P-loop containing nucleoside triphosphate hydrolase protein [Penicillium malachiteum]